MMAKMQDTKKTINEKIEQIKPEAEKVVKAAADVAKTTTETAKTAAKKATKAVAEKAKAEKAAVTEELILQYAGKEMTQQQIMDAVKQQYVAEGHEMSEIKTVKVYIKPEDGRAYFVVNDSYAGSIEL